MSTASEGSLIHRLRFDEMPEDVDFEVDDTTAPCSRCGKVIAFNSVTLAFVGLHGVNCDECVEDYVRRAGIPPETLKATKVQTVREAVEALIPPLYRETDPERLHYRQRQEVMAWEPKSGGKGIWLLGKTRTGKTRTICLLLERLIGEGHRIRAFFHGSFGDDLMEVIRSDRSFRAWKRSVVNAPVLFIDDLFANKLTERVETATFEIIDERIAYLRPTIVTTQLTRKEAVGRFHSSKRCDALFGRVREFFHVIPSGAPEQEKLDLPGGGR